MTINFNTLQDSLYAWAQAAVPLNTPVIWYYPNAPRPEVPYLTLNIQSFAQMGWDYIPRPIDNPGNVILKGDREFVLSVQAYGSTAMQMLENLRTTLQAETVRASLRASGLVYFAQQPIIDLTTLIDSRFEPRAGLDLSFRIGQQYAEALGTIATVELTEQYFDAAEVLIFDETYLIPPA
jgi:hypothetical protein